MAEMVNIANPLWSELSQKDKNYFNLRAKEASKGGLSMAKVVADTRLDCLGEPLADRVDEKGQTEERRKTERQFTRARWPVGKAAARCRFYFIDFQFICHVEKGNYFPCEIAVIEYSIDSGIVRSWHKFIDPGKIPTGYRWEAQNRSEQTHKVPIEKFELAENNYQLILDELQQFINPRRESEFPPIFTRKDEAEMVESCCRWLAERTEAHHDLFKVYVLEYLLIDLSSHISDIAPSTHEAKDMLSSSAFDYEPGVNCAWHETREIRHCSLGTVNRLAYILSEHLCPKYNVPMGTMHFPLVKENQQHTVLSPGPQDTPFVLPSRDYRNFPSRQTPINSTFEREDNESVTSFATELTHNVFQPASKQGFRPPVVGSSSPKNTGLKGRGRARGRMSGDHEQREVGGAYSTSGTVGDTLHDIDSESLVSAETALNSLQISSVSEKKAVQPQTGWYTPQNQSLPPDYYNPYPTPLSVPSPAPLYHYAPPPPSHPQNMYPQQIPSVPNGVPQYNNSIDIGQNAISHYPGQLPVSSTTAVVSPPRLHTPNSTPTPLQQPGHTYTHASPSLYQYPQYQPAPQQPYLYAPPNTMASYLPQQSPATLLQPQVTPHSYIPNPSQGVTQPMQQPASFPVPPMLPPQTQVPPYQQYSQYPVNSAQNGPYTQPQYVAPHSQAMHPNSNQYTGSVPIQQPYYPHPHQQIPTPEQVYSPANIPTQLQ
eukprot:TRINITY_DN1523_c0_g1_i2.p1 TRINITY_DN1523_c0_g1~~TRINITY_DN1523_c0_g1_i2.p1  ORF type:complete len:765 (+),score=147.47 TRINITY_DN1523_c0_g1_i2:161-2296(+)